MAFQSPQLFHSLSPQPVQDLSSLHGLWEVLGQATAYPRAAHPLPSLHVVTATEGGYNSGPHSQQIPLSSRKATHPYSRDAKRFEKHPL